MYQIKHKKLKRIIPIESVAGITKNMQANSKEFVIHVVDEEDYRLACEHRDDLIDLIK